MAYTETSNTLVQTRDMVYRLRQETWNTGTDKRHGTQAQTKGKNDAKAHKQGDMIYTATYRDMEHTFTNRDMKTTYSNSRHGTQAQTRDMVHRHRQKVKMKQKLTNKET